MGRILGCIEHKAWFLHAKVLQSHCRQIIEKKVWSSAYWVMIEWLEHLLCSKGLTLAKEWRIVIRTQSKQFLLIICSKPSISVLKEPIRGTKGSPKRVRVTKQLCGCPFTFNPLHVEAVVEFHFCASLHMVLSLSSTNQQSSDHDLSSPSA